MECGRVIVNVGVVSVVFVVVISIRSRLQRFLLLGVVVVSVVDGSVCKIKLFYGVIGANWRIRKVLHVL